MVTPEHHVALVDHLVDSSAPVRRIWPIRFRMAFFFVCWAGAGALVASISPRPDLVQKFRELGFAIEITALIAATIGMILLALRCAVPGRAPGRLEAGGAFLVVLVAAAALALQPAGHPMNDPWRCSIRTVALAVPPWAMLLIAVRRGAPVRVADAAMYAGSAALLFATTVLRAACPTDGTQHWLLWHLGTLPLVLILTAPLVVRWLRTWRHI